jgi:hypothetical protein
VAEATAIFVNIKIPGNMSLAVRNIVLRIKEHLTSDHWLSNMRGGKEY